MFPHIQIAWLILVNCVVTGHLNLFVNVNQNICKLKPNFVSRDKVISTSIKNIFDCVVRNGTAYNDCNSPNGKYKFNCNRCSLQYVGKDVQRVNKRFNWHRT